MVAVELVLEKLPQLIAFKQLSCVKKTFHYSSGAFLGQCSQNHNKLYIYVYN